MWMIKPAKEVKSTNKKVSKAISLITNSTELEANPLVLNIIEECCAKAGVTKDLVYKTLKEGLTATVGAQEIEDGQVKETKVIDYNVRYKYMLTALELLKHLKDKNVVAMAGIFNDPTIAEDARRILELRNG